LQVCLPDAARSIEFGKFDYALLPERNREKFLREFVEKNDIGGLLTKYKELQPEAMAALKLKVSSSPNLLRFLALNLPVCFRLSVIFQFSNLLSTNKKNYKKHLTAGVKKFLGLHPLATDVLAVEPMQVVAKYWLEAMWVVTSEFCTNSNRKKTENSSQLFLTSLISTDK
jgi:hypothetical protein